MKAITYLYPQAPNEWLWRNHDPEKKREFIDNRGATIDTEDLPNWHDCTTAEKEAYEEQWAIDHPEEQAQEEPIVENAEEVQNI